MVGGCICLRGPTGQWEAPLLWLCKDKQKLIPFYCFPLFLCTLITEEGLSLLAIFWNSAFKWVYLSFTFHFSSFHSCL